MARLGEKYIAGFLDADGSIGVQFVAASSRPQLWIDFSQNLEQDEVLHLIHEELGVGSICVRTSNMGTQYSSLNLRGANAYMLLSRIGQYLVVKRHFASVVCDLYRRSVRKEEIPRITEYLKVHRMMRSDPLPVYPSARWVAGYLDGDGCLSVTRIRKPFGQAQIQLHVAADVRKTEGLELLCKAYGGNIYDMRGGRCKQWSLNLGDPSKIVQVLGNVAPHMVVKADQAYFLLGVAKMGHLRDGENIKAGLKLFKAQPHRLNEPRAKVADILTTVHDLPKQVRTDYGSFVRNVRGHIIGKRVQATVEPA
jgi:hypothetical protein